MSLELAMNAIGALGHASGSLVSGGVFTIVSTPSIKNKAEGRGLYRGPLSYTFAGGDASGFDPGTVATIAPQVISPTALKVKPDGLCVVRLGDSGSMAAVGTQSGSPVAVIGSVEVADAGQNTVRAQ